jgi:hypothetical protein
MHVYVFFCLIIISLLRILDIFFAILLIPRRFFLLERRHLKSLLIGLGITALCIVTHDSHVLIYQRFKMVCSSTKNRYLIGFSVKHTKHKRIRGSEAGMPCSPSNITCSNKSEHHLLKN